jgi:hypothetical protein
MNDIRYWKPVGDAWKRMVLVLFRPFQLAKWMPLGFTVFLAQCGRNGGGNFNSGSSHRTRQPGCGTPSPEAFFRELRDGAIDLWAEHATLILVIAGCLLVLSIGIFLLTNWLNSRGQLMFLSNLMKNRAEVSAPWKQYKKEANSLMAWQIALWFLSLGLGLLLLAAIAFPILSMIAAQSVSPERVTTAVSLFVMMLIVFMGFGFVQMMLTDFVVPLMCRYRLTVPQACRHFWPLLRQHFMKFVLYGLVIFLVGLAAGVLLFIGIVLTCCTALLILIIPYIGTVALLPLYVFRQYIGLEFMKQFGSEYDLLTEFEYAPARCPPPPPVGSAACTANPDRSEVF